MKFYKTDLVNKVRKARKLGLSLLSIEKNTRIPSSTVSRWVRDIEINNTFYKNARIFEDIHRKKLSYLTSQYKKSQDTDKIFLSLLYWCEGSKYPSSNCIAFTNSDYQLMKTFITLLRSSFDIQENKLRARLQLHETHNVEKEFRFWSKLLNISIIQFGKPTITKPTKKRKRQNYRGTCTIKYYDVKLLLNIIGIYESFSQRFTSGEVA